jgi:sulfotransferase family protein
MELTPAPFISCMPLDLAISYSHHLGETIDWTIRLMNSPGAGTPNTPTKVFQQLRSWSEHVTSWTARPHPGLHVIRYEEMLSTPEQTFGGVANFLGLRPPRERLLRAIERSGFQELQRREEAHGFNERGRHLKRFFPRRSRRSVARSSHADTGPAHRRSARPDHAAIRLFSAGWLRERV